MPRQARKKSSTGIYHIILRSVNQQILFEEKEDFQKFLYVLSDCKEKYDFELYAYCIMSNHVHLLLKDKGDNLSSIFRSLGTRFVRWYNQKYSRFGHLFQDRYFSAPVENHSYFLSVLTYIHNNPVKSNICTYANEYVWSSCRSYYSKKPGLTDTDYAISILGSRRALQAYFARHCAVENNEIVITSEQNAESLAFIDEVAFSRFQEISGSKSPFDVQQLPLTDRNRLIRKLAEAHLSYSQISRYCGISRSTIYRIVKANKAP